MLSPSLSLLTFIVTFLLFSSTSFYFDKFLLTLIFSVELSLLPRLQSRSCIAFNCQVPLVHFNLKESPVFCFVLLCIRFVVVVAMPVHSYLQTAMWLSAIKQPPFYYGHRYCRFKKKKQAQ